VGIFIPHQNKSNRLSAGHFVPDITDKTDKRFPNMSNRRVIGKKPNGLSLNHIKRRTKKNFRLFVLYVNSNVFLSPKTLKMTPKIPVVRSDIHIQMFYLGNFFWGGALKPIEMAMGSTLVISNDFSCTI